MLVEHTEKMLVERRRCEHIRCLLIGPAHIFVAPVAIVTFEVSVPQFQ